MLNTTCTCTCACGTAQVGSYATSDVPTATDFARLDPSVFQPDPRVLAFLTEKYPEGYGFLVCLLDKVSSSYLCLLIAFDATSLCRIRSIIRWA